MKIKTNNKITSLVFAIIFIFIAIATLFFASYRKPANTSFTTEVYNPIVGAPKQPDIAGDKKNVLLPNKNSVASSISGSISSATIPAAENKSAQSQNQFGQQPDTNLVKVTLTVGNNRYDISVQKEATVYDAMTRLASSTNTFSFSARYYSGLGYFIDAINGIKNANGNYWTLYVNGAYATVGASAYQLSANDSIEWKYTDKAN